MRVPVERLKELSAQLAAALVRVEECETPDELLGIEGEAAQKYFSGFDSLVLQQRDVSHSTGRSPPPAARPHKRSAELCVLPPGPRLRRGA